MAVEKTASKIRGMEQDVTDMVVEVTGKVLTPRPTPPQPSEWRSRQAALSFAASGQAAVAAALEAGYVLQSEDPEQYHTAVPGAAC